MTEQAYEWARAEERGLARYVQPQHLPAEWRLPAYIGRLDLLRAEGALGVAAVLYAGLLKRQLQYDLAPFSPRAGVTQLIRRPATIYAEQRGTCLDLAVLFATQCLDSDLLPLLVVVEGHAFAGLSLTRTRQEDKKRPKDLAWDRGQLTELAVLQALTDQEYAWVECTGAAHSHALAATFPEGQGRDVSGVMSFERACAAGREQLLAHVRSVVDPARPDQREFLYALDIQDLQVNQGFAPVTDEEAADPATGGQTLSGSHSIQFGPGATVHGGVVMGDQRHVNTGGGRYYEGPITVADGDFVGGNKVVNQHAGGDIVGRDKITTSHEGDQITVGNIDHSSGIAIGRGAQASVSTGLSGGDLQRLFAEIYRQIETRPVDPAVDKDEVKEKVQRIQEEAKQGDKANEPKLGRWLGDLAGMAPDIFDVTVAALGGPVAVAGTVVKKIADKAKQLYGRGQPPASSPT